MSENHLVTDDQMKFYVVLSAEWDTGYRAPIGIFKNRELAQKAADGYGYDSKYGYVDILEYELNKILVGGLK